MAYELSYKAGLRPFNHDKHRGKWASPMDFFFACIGHSFKVDAIFILPSLIFQEIGFYALIPYFIIVVGCTVPIVFMQSFLGQFSSTGFISVFRISPLFKGIGYVSLALNLTTLTYYSIFAAIPLFYFIHSLRPTLPWSCEGTAHWYEHNEHKITHCNITKFDLGPDDYIVIEEPSLDFFLKLLKIEDHNGHPEVTFSWALILCAFSIWITVWAILRNPIEKIGRIIRYTTTAMLAILGICFLRFIFLPGAFTRLLEFFTPTYLDIGTVSIIHVLALSGLGPGWGSILSMASYNGFKNDIAKHTWVLCLGHFFVMIIGYLSLILIENSMISSDPNQLYLPHRRSQWMQFFSVPTSLTLLEWPNLWSLLYFGMLTLGATNLLAVQVFSALTALFDEFEQLRRRRENVIRITVGLLALCSILFSSNHGMVALEYIGNYSILTQIFLNLMLLLVAVWIYGMERFQRDLQFMTSRTYPTWMVYVVKFVAPIFLFIAFFVGVDIALYRGLLVVLTLVVVLPWLLVPGYCIFKIMQTSGFMGIRLKLCLRPTDWYPADPVDRQRYEETFSHSEMTNQLVTASEDE